MKKLSFSFCFLLLGIILYGQQLTNNEGIINAPILSAESLKKGIYLSFNEFQQNDPSLKTDFRSSEMNLPDNNIYNNLDASRLRITGSDGIVVPFLKSHWGLCDGKKVFINFKGKYFQVSLDGKYSSFTASRRANYGSTSFGIDYVLNIVTGKITEISSVYGYRNKVRIKAVNNILSGENPALYREFAEDENKKMMVFTYIKRLNDGFVYR